jgi:D-serine deaminase-like pyridoxal phosphate-dependent protein
MLVEQPKLLVDEEIVRRNIKKMANKAKESNVIFRPHFKTHQSKDIAEWFREVGVKKITVSSLTMAEYFAINNWHDITVAFPTNINEIKKINALANKISLGLLVESKEVVAFLSDHLTKPVKIWVKIDTGNHRTGIAWDNYPRIIQLLKQIKKSDKMTFSGLLSHAGHAYKATSKEEIKEIYFDTSKK